MSSATERTVVRAVQLLREHAAAKSAKPRARSAAAELPTGNPQELTFAVKYLDAFGYLGKALAGWQDITLGDVIKAVGQFQRIFGLRASGDVTPKTLKAMEMPRCGCPDIIQPYHPEYAKVRAWARAQLPSWRKRSLRYHIRTYLPGLQRADQEVVFRDAFGAWCQHGNVNVEQTGEAAADILIGTGEGPRSNFDGAGGTLAWAYLPDGSDRQLLMLFDLGETWVLTPQQRGILLGNVACHEFGHLFGLDHSRVQGALMAPYYSPLVGLPQANDDVPRFQARYGQRTDPPPPPAGAALVNIVTQGNVKLIVNGKVAA